MRSGGGGSCAPVSQNAYRQTDFMKNLNVHLVHQPEETGTVGELGAADSIVHED
jgi:hypothetical protein